MYPRTERILTFVAFFVAIAIAVVGGLKVEQRRNEKKTAAAGPSASFTATPLASPPPTQRSEATVTTPAPATPSVPPPPTPTAPPAVAATPFVRPPGASPMPHTGGGAVPQGLLLTALAALGAVVARHTEARTRARSSTG